MSKPTKPQIKKYHANLVQIMIRLGAKLEHMEESVLKADGGSKGAESDEFGADSSREFQLGLIVNEDDMLRDVKDAFDRIERGVFGACEGCEDWIPPRRLTTLPFARYCVGCQEKSENGELNSDD